MKDEPAHPSSFRLHPSPLSPGAAASRRSSFDGYPGESTRIAGLVRCCVQLAPPPGVESELRPDRFERVAARPVAGDRAQRVMVISVYPGEFTRIGAGLLGAEGAILVISPGCVSRSA